MLGGDIVVAGNKKVLAAVKHGATRMVVNTAEFLPGDFTRNADFSLPTERLKRAIVAAAGSDNVSFIDASRLATALLGNSIAANMFLVGYAFQMGALPLSAESIEQAIEMNGEAVAMNQAAFRWGRRAALDIAAVEKLIPTQASQDDNRRLSQTSRRDRRAPRRIPDRISECGLCAPLQRFRREGPQGRRRGPRAAPGSPRRSRAICSS